MNDRVEYTVAQFVADTEAVSGLARADDSAANTGDDGLAAICGYFVEQYGPEDGPRFYLQFGAVHAAIGRHRHAIDGAGLSDPEQPAEVDQSLLLLLLNIPVRVDTQERQAWLKDAEVRAALQRASTSSR